MVALLRCCWQPVIRLYDIPNSTFESSEESSDESSPSEDEEEEEEEEVGVVADDDVIGKHSDY